MEECEQSSEKYNSNRSDLEQRGILVWSHWEQGTGIVCFVNAIEELTKERFLKLLAVLPGRKLSFAPRLLSALVSHKVVSDIGTKFVDDAQA